MRHTRRQSDSGLPLYASTSAVQPTIPHPTFTLPLTPPSTPPDFKFSTLSHMNQQYASSSSSSSRRNRVPSLDDSPLTLPTLMSDDEDSPNGSTGAITPPTVHVSEFSTPRIVTDHDVLNALSQETTPRHYQDGFEGRGTYPLLSPQRPLSKKQMWPHIERASSPPTTPKGHPLSRSDQGYFSNSFTIISKPPARPKFRTSLSYLLRVPRRSRPCVILAFCVFSFFAFHLLSAVSILPSASTPTTIRRALPRLARTTVVPTGLPSIKFESDEEELAALISFITSTSANMLPQLDTSKPLEPSAILDFDPTHPHARQDLDLLKEEIHTLYPLILFGKMRDPWHREVKKMLAEYKIVPAPLIIELDQRRDNSVLSPVLARLLGTNELPLLSLFGKSLGSYHDVLGLREKGELKSVLEAGGLSVKPAKKNKKTVKEKQREENERILGPRPIVDGI